MDAPEECSGSKPGGSQRAYVVRFCPKSRHRCWGALEDEIVLVHRALFFAEFLADRNKVATTNANSEISNANCEFRDKGSSILNAARGSLHIEQGSSFVWSMSWPRVRIGKAT